MTPRERELEEALLMCAAHCQGGHSAAGMTVAMAFSIPFPLTMENLIATALRRGYAPAELWPWSSTARIAALAAPRPDPVEDVGKGRGDSGSGLRPLALASPRKFQLEDPESAA